MSLAVQTDALGLVFFERGDDRNFPADAAQSLAVQRDKLALASLLDERVRLLKMRQHRGDEGGSARHRAEV